MKLGEINLKNSEVLEIGFFSNDGGEKLSTGMWELASHQILTGVAFENIKYNHRDMDVFKTENGYETAFVRGVKAGRRYKNGTWYKVKTPSEHYVPAKF